MLGWDDEVWKVFINGGFGFLISALGLYLTFKVNKISNRQIVNSDKIDVAASKAAVAAAKADVAAKRVDEVGAKQAAHLADQDAILQSVHAKVEEVVKQTNGMMEKLTDVARKEGEKIGEKAALEKLGLPDKRDPIA